MGSENGFQGRLNTQKKISRASPRKVLRDANNNKSPYGLWEAPTNPKPAKFAKDHATQCTTF